MSSRITKLGLPAVLLLSTGALSVSSYAKNNEVLGEVRFQADNGAAKSAGVWVDGRYVGYLNELKGSKKLLLLPGEHQISVREAGFQSVDQTLSVQPDQIQILHVSLVKDPRARLPTVSAEVKLSIDPDRAAVFVDDQFAGHAHEFGGAEPDMIVTTGTNRIKISLPGYQSFETEIEVRANQKYDIKTQLPRGTESD
jgi:hypothetical protein